MTLRVRAPMGPRLTRPSRARPLLSVATIACVGACSAPDISTELDTAATFVAQVSEETQGDLLPVAAAELATAQEQRLADGKAIYALDGECDLAELERVGATASACRLDSLAELPTTPSATVVLETLALLNGYFIGLNALLSSEAPERIETNAAALTAALQADGAERIAAFAAISAALDGRDEAPARVLGFLARQQQRAGLRQAIRAADPVIRTLTNASAAYYRAQDTQILAANDALLRASIAVNEAQLAGDIAALRAASVQLQERHAAFVAIEAASPAGQFWRVRDLHAALLDRINRPTSAEAILNLVTELEAVLGAVKEEDT